MTTATPHTAGPADFLTEALVTQWVEGYLTAWRSNERSDITALFTPDAEYHETPYDTDWVGIDEIVEGWQSRWDWQQGGWEFEWAVASTVGPTAVVTGVGRYRKLGDFDNTWTVTFDRTGRCIRFDMLNTERS